MSEISCEKYQQQLATYRDLDPAEWEALQRHVESCPACARALAVFQHQDCVLGALPKRTPSPALAAGVRARTLDRRGYRSPWVWRWASFAAVAVVIVAMTFGGAATASAEALPGDFLYPVKRAVERVQYTFTTDPLAREAYLEKLLQKRQEEVRRVQELERDVEMTLEGPLQGVEGGRWNIGGLMVQIPGELWAGEGIPETGDVIRVRVRVNEGGMVAVQVRIKASKMVRTPVGEARTPESAGQHDSADQPSVTSQPVDVGGQTSATPTAQEPTVEAEDNSIDPTLTPTAEEPDPAPTERGPNRFLTATPPGIGPRWGLTKTPQIVPGLSRTPNPPIVPPGQTRTPQPPGQTRMPPAGPGRFLTATPRIVLPPLPPATEPTKGPDKPGRASPTPGKDEPEKPGKVSPTPEKEEPEKPGKVSPTPDWEEPAWAPTPTPTEDPYPYPSPTEPPAEPNVRATRRARIIWLNGNTP